MKKLILNSLLILAFFNVQSQTNISDKEASKLRGLAAITEDAVRGQLEFLASPWTEGRETGSRGSFMAADYIASLLKVYGITPLGQYPRLENLQSLLSSQKQTYFQDFSLLESSPGDVQKMSVSFTDGSGIRKVDLNYHTDFSCGNPEISYDLTGPVVFVGYGIKDESKQINELKGLDLKGKIVLRLKGVPGMNYPNSAAMNKFGATLYTKDEYILKAGALAVMDVATDDDIQGWADNYPYHFKTPVYEGNTLPDYLKPKRMRIPIDTLSTGLKGVTITKRVANEILRGSGITIDGYAKNAADLKFLSLKNLTGISANMVMTAKNRIVKARNILGMIEGEIKDEYVVVGGHYDHLGIQNGFIYNGADDNGSGSVGILTLAKAFMASGIKPKYSIIFAFWTGEEKGLLGSNYFVNNSDFKDKKIVFYLNYDMISRSSPEDTLQKAVRIIYTKAFSQFEEKTNRNLKEYGIDLRPNFVPMEQPRGGSDFTAFSLKNVPLMTWNAGHSLDYHQLSDEVSKVNWSKMVNIIKLGFLDVWDIVNGDILIGKNK
ncbi:MAG: M20/M25/M40 family metallo-hydrolase [Bacteroidota bacterium]|nr:M20/M25/M40 family metallo-hydrolase [Bacteroidota bacterium]